MKSKIFTILFFLLLILCILFGIGGGIYFQFSDDSTSNEDNPTNWKRGFFRLTLVLSVLVGILGGTFFASLAKKGKLADEDDGDPPSKVFTVPKFAFLVYFFWFLIFVWLAYFIIQWPVYYIVIFVIEGFTS